MSFASSTTRTSGDGRRTFAGAPTRAVAPRKAAASPMECKVPVGSPPPDKRTAIIDAMCDSLTKKFGSAHEALIRTSAIEACAVDGISTRSVLELQARIAAAIASADGGHG